MPSVQIEEALHQVLIDTDLLAFEHVLAIEKQLTKISHFDDVTDEELMSYGLSSPAVRRLRTALNRIKKAKKSKLFSKPKPPKLITANCEREPSSSQSVPTESAPCLISRDDVKLMETIGNGTFAQVKRGVWQRSGSLIKMDCAVKVLHQMSDSAIEDLHGEVAQMQNLRHTNIVRLYGIVLGEPTMMVLEFCDGGALLNRLRDSKKPILLVTKLLNYALQIATGMAYLESKRCVHRDLAARNVLLSENEETIKICDFGLTRSLDENERLYVMSGQKKVPFSWCPPESLRYRQFSHKSDVWAFGVTLWELYTYGEEPWAGYRAADVLRMTEAGERLKKPTKSLTEIYGIMEMCWDLNPESRPKFGHLRNLLLDIKFMTAETRDAFVHSGMEADYLELNAKDHVIIITENAQKEWFGQCVRTRKFGRFPFSLVSVRSNRIAATEQRNGSMTAAVAANTPFYNGNISKPVPGSLIHAGHGDLEQNKCWGHVDHIDPIYLKNPVTRNDTTSPTTSHKQVKIIQNAGSIHSDTTANISVKLDFDPLKAWDLPSVPIAPSKIASSPPPLPKTTKPKIPTVEPATDIRPPNSVRKASLPSDTDAFNSLKTEYEKLKLGQQMPLAPLPQNSSSMTARIWTNFSEYNPASAVPRPGKGSPILNGTMPAASDPFVIPPSLQKTSAENTSRFTPPTTSGQFLQRNSSEIAQSSFAELVGHQKESTDDPFYVDPNLSLRLKSSSSISWRRDDSRTQSMIQIPRPQSARLTTQTPKPKPVEIDQNVLALLDPLLTKNASNIQQKSVTVPTNGQQKVAIPSVNIQPIPRPVAQNTLSKPKGGIKVLPTEPLPSKTAALRREVPTTQSTQPTVVSTSIPTSSFLASSQPNNTAVNIRPVGSLNNSLPATSSAPSQLSAARPASALLPPPSELLLSGLRKNKPDSSDSAYGTLSSTFSLTTHDFGSTANAPTKVFNIQRPNNSILPSYTQQSNPQQQQSVFLSNGIPHLYPTPLTQKPIPSQSQAAPIPSISLSDLDVDQMLSSVKKAVDFASPDQCRKALRAADFSVETAIRSIKADKLIEMGLCNDRQTAVRALENTDWNVNDAAIQLVS